MKNPFISVIVPAHNEERYISECLESLLRQDYPKENYEIIVIDNNSEDKTKSIANSFDVKVIDQLSGPVGAVRNRGVRTSKGQILAFIDADCVAAESWLSTGAMLLSDSNTVYGGGFDLPANPSWIESAWLLENKRPPRELLGCCIFIMRDTFFSAGEFDEEITSGEDTKLSLSLKEKGYSVVMTAELNVIHNGNPVELKHFFRRQIWHSENYFQNWSDTKKDPTFYFLVIFFVGLVSAIMSAFFGNTFIFSLSVLIVAIIPAVFSLKRLRRSKNVLGNLRILHFIYFLDFSYLSGRLVGLYRSAQKMRFGGHGRLAASKDRDQINR